MYAVNFRIKVYVRVQFVLVFRGCERGGRGVVKSIFSDTACFVRVFTNIAFLNEIASFLVRGSGVATGDGRYALTWDD